MVGGETTTPKSVNIKLPQPITKDKNLDSKSGDRKFNVIVYGVKESSKGTRRDKRVLNDLAATCDILSSVDAKVSADSIRDCFRLGGYKQDRNRPILVKFVRCHDASLILSNKRNLSSIPGISIKPDLSPEDRRTESLLLKERRSLIASGVDRKVIKIRGSTLFVNNVKHGCVVNSVLKVIPPCSQDVDFVQEPTDSQLVEDHTVSEVGVLCNVVSNHNAEVTGSGNTA